MTPLVAAKKLSKFNLTAFLSSMDGGRKIAAFPKKQTIFVQGDSSDAASYIQKGKVKLTVVSQEREGSHDRQTRAISSQKVALQGSLSACAPQQQ